MTDADVIQALAREDSTVNDEPPLADLAIATWRQDCTAEPRATVWIHGEEVKTIRVVGAIDALGSARATELYAEEWERITAERSAKHGWYDISQEIDTLRRRLLTETDATKQSSLVMRIDRLTDMLAQPPRTRP